jgi:4a-hydroxytetrahydrobiopterin dehydratase
LCFSVTGFCLIVMWMFKLCLGITLSEINDTPSPAVPAWWWQSGVLFFGIGWLWSLITSISMILEAKQTGSESRRPAPPKLNDLPTNPPPILNASMKPLTPPQIETALSTVPEWKYSAATITRTFQFKDFPAAMIFVNQAARLAEAAGHHPDIDIRWNKVTLALTTHDAGGLTEKDFALARQYDCLV